VTTELPLGFEHTVVVSGHHHPDLSVLTAEVQAAYPDYTIAIRDVDYFAPHNSHVIIMDLTKRLV